MQHPLGKRPEPFVQVGEGHALVVKDLLEVRDRRARIVFCKKKTGAIGVDSGFFLLGFSILFRKTRLITVFGVF